MQYKSPSVRCIICYGLFSQAGISIGSATFATHVERRVICVCAGHIGELC